MQRAGGDGSRAAAGVHGRPTAFSGLQGPTPQPTRFRERDLPIIHRQDAAHRCIQ